MAENSNIEWTDATFNPWIGCTKVSPGCRFCYAEKQDNHRKWTPDGWGRGKPRKRTSESYWRQPIKWNRIAATADTRPRVFCASLADVFDDEAPQEWRDDLWELIHKTPHLDWLLLTKRPENIRDMVPPCWLEGDWRPNVWIGTTIEDQAAADQRIPILCGLPAPVRFLSCEPLLEQVWFPEEIHDIHWVICGGESGAKARPMLPAWARSLRDQCRDADVPFLFKQWGAWGPGNDGRLIKAGKKNTGRELDGETWDQFPLVKP